MAANALFVDFNSYFASVEQQENPAYRGKPLAVLPVLADTTCCIAASYEAKAFGVKTGTRVWEAKQRCPDIIFVQANHEHYVHYHHRLVAAVESCAPVAEVRSIDEMWCEMTGSWRAHEVAVQKAKQIKQHIETQIGECLTTSIGIAPNWFLAKIASNMQKPNGLTLLDKHNLHERMFALQLSDIYGIGRRTEARFHHYGISTVEQLYAASKEQLHQVYRSVQGERLYDLLRGRTVYSPPTQRASISHSHVLPPQLRNNRDALAVMHRLLQKAMVRLRAMDYSSAELSVKVAYHQQASYKRYARFTATDDTADVSRALNALWKQRPKPRAKPSAVGIALGKLAPIELTTGDLFNPKPRKSLNEALDKLNARYGKNTIYYGSSANALDEAPMRIAFTRIPDVVTER